MSDIDKLFNKELSIEDLEGVNGGTKAEWHVLDVLFNGADMWDAKDLDLHGRSKLEEKITKITGFKVNYGMLNLKKDIVLQAPDGTLMDLYEFLDYLQEHYTMDEVLTWSQM